MQTCALVIRFRGMKKHLAGLLSAALLATPMFAAAQTVSNDQLVSLYTQLISLLKQQVLLLQQQRTPSLSLIQPSTKAPSTVVFTVVQPTGTEIIDYGDGSATGSRGCVKNVFGFCDLWTSVSHIYETPGTYTVRLLNRVGGTVNYLSTTTVTATK